MADYRTHITTSSVLGVGYGLAATLGVGFTPVQGALAAVLTGVAGMLPDLDSDSGRPLREVFGMVAAVGPLLLMNRLDQWGGSREAALLLAVVLYVALRYGVSTLLSMVSVHRGMFHSIPALLIAAEVTFLAYLDDSTPVRWLMAFGVALGFGSHLVLDEIYSVRWNGAVITLKPSAGSAVKVIGKSWPANILCIGLALTLGYAVVVDGGWSQTSARQAAVGPRQQSPPKRPGTAGVLSQEDLKGPQPGGVTKRPAPVRQARSSLHDDEELLTPRLRRESLR